MNFRRGAAALAVSVFALGGMAACGDDETETRETAEPTTAEVEQQAIPTPEELTELLDRASDPNVPVEEKVDLVQGGDEAPELFDQIAQIKEQQNAEVVVTNTMEGLSPGTLQASAILRSPGEEDLNLDARFIQNAEGQWQLEQSFACALISNAGLQPPPSCELVGEPMPEGGEMAPPAEGQPAPEGGEMAPPPEGGPAPGQ